MLELDEASLFVDQSERLKQPLAVTSAALAAHGPGDTHICLLQDDVLPVSGLPAHVKAYASSYPEGIITMYTPAHGPRSQIARLSALNGKRAARVDAGDLSTVGMILPVRLAKQASDFLKSQLVESMSDSDAMRTFASQVGAPVFSTVPSLVQHDARGVSSTLGNSVQRGIRQAAYFENDVPIISRSVAYEWQGDVPYLDPDTQLAMIISGSGRTRRIASHDQDPLAIRLTAYAAGLEHSRSGCNLLAPRMLAEGWLVAYVMGSLLRDWDGVVGRRSLLSLFHSLKSVINPSLLKTVSEQNLDYLAEAVSLGQKRPTATSARTS